MEDNELKKVLEKLAGEEYFTIPEISARWKLGQRYVRRIVIEQGVLGENSLVRLGTQRGVRVRKSAVLLYEANHLE